VLALIILDYLTNLFTHNNKHEKYQTMAKTNDGLINPNQPKKGDGLINPNKPKKDGGIISPDKKKKDDKSIQPKKQK